jgi:hypothetical protein
MRIFTTVIITLLVLAFAAAIPIPGGLSAAPLATHQLHRRWLFIGSAFKVLKSAGKFLTKLNPLKFLGKGSKALGAAAKRGFTPPTSFATPGVAALAGLATGTIATAALMAVPKPGTAAPPPIETPEMATYDPPSPSDSYTMPAVNTEGAPIMVVPAPDAAPVPIIHGPQTASALQPPSKSQTPAVPAKVSRVGGSRSVTPNTIIVPPPLHAPLKVQARPALMKTGG